MTLGLTSVSYVLKHLHLQPLANYHFHSASILPLTKSPMQFFVRAALDFNLRQVLVFDDRGVKLYTIERALVLNPLWTMYSFPDRRPVATIVVALTFASVDFLNRTDYCHRNVLVDIGASGMCKSFFMPDGAKYSWTTGLRFLEKVLSPYCGEEEVRVRIAHAKLMRQFRLDFEVLVDADMLDPEVALTTAFISMLTQWGCGNAVAGVGPTYIERPPACAVLAESPIRCLVNANYEPAQSSGLVLESSCSMLGCVIEPALDPVHLLTGFASDA